MLLFLSNNNKKIARVFFTLLYLQTILTGYANAGTNQFRYEHLHFSHISKSILTDEQGPFVIVPSEENDSNTVVAEKSIANSEHQDHEETSGPTQPEMKSFESVNTNNMVDLFTGDFSYNIPLLDVGGYPVNIHYSSGISMDQEASWVGLGWNINPGTVSRNLRGMPDDFNGTDSLSRTQHIKDNKTIGVSLQGSLEIFGNPGKKLISPNLSATIGIFKNTYNGYGIETGVGIGGTGKTAFGSLTGNLSISNNSQTGLSVSPSLSAKIGTSDADNNMRGTLGISTGYSSRGGISSLQFNGGIQSDATDFRKISQYAYAGANNSFPLASISFAVPAYSPTISMPISNSSFSFTGKLGGEISGADASAAFTGYVNNSSIQAEDTTQKIPAIGYLYSTMGNNRENVLLDFNREKELEFNYKSTPHIALPQYTYDAFSISGEGTGGSFRAYRGDVGYVFDHSITTRSSSTNGSVDVGAGAYAHGGWEITNVTTSNENHRWNQANLIEKKLSFTNDHDTYESVYFRNPGEKAINPQSYYNKIGDDSLIRIKLTGSKDKVNAANTFIKYANGQKAGEILVSDTIVKQQRDKRTQMISYLTAKDAAVFGLDRRIKSYYENSIPIGNCAGEFVEIPRSGDGMRKENHISEVQVLNSDGRRYVYDIPVYNLKQEDVTFAVDGTQDTTGYYSKGLIKYNPGFDNSTRNTNGKDGYYSRESMPAYAHSFLLSGILSPDYIDLTGNGISEDDPGDAVKFNYTQVYGKLNGYYSWRTPMTPASGTANYNEGLKTYNRDDKGTYIYGQKEMWYLNSIESKTMIAVFTLANDRQDAYAATAENGGINPSQSARRLEKIDLYAKADLLKNGSSAKPIKTVHFAYSYTLCKGYMSNASNGKLTLDSLWFTYNNNNKGKLNPYMFRYHPDANNKPSADFNPDYNTKSYDRWGTYKDPSGNPGGLNNTDYPYTIQDSNRAATYASAWHLTDIKLPSGGKMKVTYEADDYAYVQNRRAEQMFSIAGIGTSTGVTLYDINAKSRDDYYTIYINSKETLASRADIRNKYLGIDSVLYFKMAVQMPTDRWGSGWELVPGYGTVVDYGLSGGNHKQFWIKLAPIQGRSPMSRAALQFFRLNLPSKAYPESEKGDNLNLADAVKMLVSGFREIRNSLDGFDDVAKGFKLCSAIDTSKSFVRLSCPSYKKYGGGVRVKRVQVSDNWNSMAGQKESVYGQEYTYTTTEDIDGKQVLTSSGVASYEPTIGGEENAWHRPISYIEKLAPAAPSSFLFSEEPVGESYFPSPMVGYSKVRVRTINARALSANGWEETEFFTTKDFPTMVEHTLLEEGDSKKRYETSSSILRLNHKNYVSLSQGFRIELNDMNGKMKAQNTYAETDSLHPIRYTLNFYKVDDDKAYQKHLNNNVWVIDSASGHIDTAGQIGKEIELMTDMREQHSLANTKGFSPNFDVIPIFGFPVPIPSFYNFPQREDVRFRSAAVVKIVQRYGILDSVVAMDKGSVVSTKNMVYDAETGNVVLSRTNNEYNDPVYNFNYPAYWAYNGMGMAYRNMNAVFGDDQSGLQLISGRLYKSGGDTSLYRESDFESGDELYVSEASVGSAGDNCRKLGTGGSSWTGRLWVIDANRGNLGDKGLYFIDSLGRVPPNLFIKSMRIIRSGKRNMPDVSAGSVVTLGNLLQQVNGNYKVIIDSTTKVLNASVATYKDLWKVENVWYQADSTYRLFKNDGSGSFYTSGPPLVFRKVQYKKNSSWQNEIPVTNKYDSSFVASDYQKFDRAKFPFNTYSYVYMLKSGVAFDLSGIPDSSKITSATLRLPPGAPAHAWDNTDVNHPHNFDIKTIFQPKTQADYYYQSSGGANGNKNSSKISQIIGDHLNFNTKFDYVYTDPILSILPSTPEDTPSCDSGSINVKSVMQSWVDNKDINYGLLIELAEGYGGGDNNTAERTMSFCGSETGYPPKTVDAKTASADVSASTCIHCAPGIHIDATYTYLKDTTVQICRKNIVDSSTNPYRWGILGNWRMERAYTYYNSRQESDASITATNIRTEGTLKSFIPFWTFTQSGLVPKLDTIRWVWNSAMSNFNRKGAEIENYDPLNRYNSGLYGYNQTMPIAVAQNSKYREMLYDGFEDYGYKTTLCTTCTPDREFDFLKGNTGVDTSTAQSHTGLYSLKVNSGKDAKLTVPVISTTTDTTNLALVAGLDSNAITTTTVVGSGTGLEGKYYGSYTNNLRMCSVQSSPSLIKTDSTINFDWTTSSPVTSTTGCDGTYTVEWRGKVQVKYNGPYYFYFTGNGSVTVVVNGMPIISSHDQTGTYKSNSILLTPGAPNSLYIRYDKVASRNANGIVQFGWKSAFLFGSQEKEPVIPKNFLYLPTADTTGSVKTIVNYWCVQARTVKPVNVIRPAFSPIQGSKMVVSGWIRLATVDCNATPMPDSAIKVDFNVGGTLTTRWLKKTGLRIEGWQRYEDTVLIPPNAAQMNIHVTTPTVGNDIYADDIRVQPFNSNLKSYVYNPFNLRLMSDLDENNYATYYEYDDDGTLIRVKKETERGIMTIKETRSALYKDQ